MRLKLFLPRSRGPRLLEDCGDDTGAWGVTLLTSVCLLAHSWWGASMQLSPPHPHPRMALLAQGTLGGPDGLREGGGRVLGVRGALSLG